MIKTVFIGENYGKELKEKYLYGVVHECIKVDDGFCSLIGRDISCVGRGPHTLRLLAILPTREVEVGNITFEFEINPDADKVNEYFYTIKPESVKIVLHPRRRAKNIYRETLMDIVEKWNKRDQKRI